MALKGTLGDPLTQAICERAATEAVNKGGVWYDRQPWAFFYALWNLWLIIRESFKRSWD